MQKKGNTVLIEYVMVGLVLILTSFTRYKLVGVLGAIAYLGVDRIPRKRERSEIGWNIKGLPQALQDNWVFVLLVVFITPLLTVFIVKLFLPAYFTHLLHRVTPYVQMDSKDKLFPQLLVLAFGEEIAFRAFLQGRLSLFIHPKWALLLSSAVFAAVHFTPGILIVVMMDLLSVFVDSLLFGIIFERSNNVFASTIAHFLGNAFGILILTLFAQRLF